MELELNKLKMTFQSNLHFYSFQFTQHRSLMTSENELTMVSSSQWFWREQIRARLLLLWLRLGLGLLRLLSVSSQNWNRSGRKAKLMNKTYLAYITSRKFKFMYMRKTRTAKFSLNSVLLW